VESGGASRTAVFVCQGRAVADGRLAVGRFADPFASRLLSEDDLAPVRRARSGEAVEDGRERFFLTFLVACAEVVVPRTVLIDDAITSALERSADAQVVLLGAGLDARPWRLQSLRRVTVLSVDHPASQADLQERAASLPEPICDLRFVPVDLTREPLLPALNAMGHTTERPTVWVWEGVIPYLTRDEVRATWDAVSAVSLSGSTLLAQYQAPSLLASFGRRLSGLVARVSRVDSPLADEPWKSFWTAQQMAALADERGWRVEFDVSLLEAARRMGATTGSSRSLASGRVLVARR
jgi:methyltransferase (TIGR00027 family)